MKTKIIFTVVIAVVLSMAMAQAQITPSTSIVSMGERDKAVLDKRISKYTTFTIDKKQLTDSLYSNGGGQFR